IEDRRRLSWPGACSRPLDFTLITLPVTSSPVLATVLPSTTTSLASVPFQVSPILAVPELSSEPSRTFTFVPAGTGAALTSNAEHSNSIVNTTDLRMIINWQLLHDCTSDRVLP